MNCRTKIKVQGHLDKKWNDYFEGMEISYEGDNTMITGNLKDESQMFGILNLVRDFNLKLISVNTEEEDTQRVTCGEVSMP